MTTSVTGYPRIGALRELKFATEKYFTGQLTADELRDTAADLRLKHWKRQGENDVELIPSGDFTLYDSVLDTAVMLGAIPARYKALGLDAFDEYFAMARGYQGEKGDVKALAMKKWFNTNYHYIVPELEDETVIKANPSKLLSEFEQAKENGISTKPVFVGAFTFLKLAKYAGKKSASDYAAEISRAYADIISRLESAGAQWIAFDEPALVLDLTPEDIELFIDLYSVILKGRKSAKALLQTYFGDMRDCYTKIAALDFDGIGLDFIEGAKNLELIKKHGFPDGKTLFAGVINGKSIWKNNYAQTLGLLNELKAFAGDIVVSTSCSLLHVPYTLANEELLSEDYKKHLAFAEEKLAELKDIKLILDSRDNAHPALLANTELFSKARHSANAQLASRIAGLTDADFIRKPDFYEREKIQREKLALPLLPTTTIGSFPQSADVKANRAAFKAGKISFDEYEAFNREKIDECIALQEQIGLDVLVHGEYERNDMVEYFGENLSGYIFTSRAWVQSYGTRCVKPPIIWGDVKHVKPITVGYSVYAQSLSKKPVKGMLTGPVTIFNWSFPRDDISPKESVLQIALAIREEVLDLEAGGISIIQIDEAALREKLPLRKSDWHSEYLDWAIPAFRLVHSGVKPDTQIHTHMCYSEFEDIIRDIDAMDADVISFEASRSSLSIIDALNDCGFKTQVGPGVYDIHSPRVPSREEIEDVLRKLLKKLRKEKLWVNPDCGLKTRNMAETLPSLENLTAAAKNIRNEL